MPITVCIQDTTLISKIVKCCMWNKGHLMPPTFWKYTLNNKHINAIVRNL